MKHLFLPFLVFVFIVFSGSVRALTLPERPQGYVSDFANILTTDEKQLLESKLEQIEKQSTVELALVTTTDLSETTIEEYAVSLFEKWGVGKKSQDNGLMIVVAPNDRQVRIEVGYGLEPLVTDAESSWIIRNILLPAFRENNYYSGINQSIDRIQSVIQKQATPQPTSNPISLPTGEIGIGTIFTIFMVFQVLFNLMASSRSWWLGGVLGAIGGLAVGSIFGFMMVGLIALGVLIPLGLIIDYFLSRRGLSIGPPVSHPWWWSSGGGGGRSGGFRGLGGGRSGGGGSSGSW